MPTRLGLMILERLDDHAKRIGSLEETSRVTREVNQADMRRLGKWLKILGVVVAAITMAAEALRLVLVLRDMVKH